MFFFLFSLFIGIPLSPSLSDEFGMLFDKETMSDMQLEFKHQNETKTIFCHSFILAVRAPNLLQFILQKKEGNSTKYKIDYFSYLALREIIFFYYFGYFSEDLLLNQTIVFSDILMICIELKLTSPFLKLSEDILPSLVTFKNAMPLLNVSELYVAPILTETCTSFISSHLLQFLSTEQFSDLSSKSVCQIGKKYFSK